MWKIELNAKTGRIHPTLPYLGNWVPTNLRLPVAASENGEDTESLSSRERSTTKKEEEEDMHGRNKKKKRIAGGRSPSGHEHMNMWDYTSANRLNRL